MADLSTQQPALPGTAPATPERPDGNGAGGTDPRPPTAAAPVDPRAVRVRLAPVSRLADEPAIRVSPRAEALRMTNPASGVGLLGGVAPPSESRPPAAASPAAAAGDSDVPDGATASFVVDGDPLAAALLPRGGDRHVLETAVGERVVRTPVVLGPPLAGEDGVVRREVLVDGYRFVVELEAERIAALRERASHGRAAAGRTGPLEVKAIIPGRVVGVSVSAGDTVTAGQQLLVVEAMKMQNELRAPRDGTIDRVAVAPGVNIEVGDLLVVIA
jgi:biotin carboxyl carrier protein